MKKFITKYGASLDGDVFTGLRWFWLCFAVTKLVLAAQKQERSFSSMSLSVEIFAVFFMSKACLRACCLHEPIST